VLDVAAYFQVGALFAVFGLERYGRPLMALTLLAVAAGLGALMDTGGDSAIAELLLLMALPFATISVGWQHLGWLERPLASGDYSYGLYLYGFPVQQGLMAASGNALSGWQAFALTLPITSACAVFSWFVIERRALAWKPQGRSAS
jgi:peptidoglycan/LPS O-acetylase OafA/YrhL